MENALGATFRDWEGARGDAVSVRPVDSPWRQWLLLPFAALLVLAWHESRASTGAPIARKGLWEVYFNRGDAAAVAGLYARDAELAMSGAPLVRGRAAIRAAISKMEHSGVKVRIGTERSVAAGNMAYFSGPYRVLLKGRLVERGTYLEVWHRYGRRWLIDLDVNASVPIDQIPQR